MDKLSRDIGEKIIIARKKMNMSQEELADLAGVSRKTMHNIECGKTQASVATINKILGVLKISLKEFFSGFDEIEEVDYEFEEAKHY